MPKEFSEMNFKELVNNEPDFEKDMDAYGDWISAVQDFLLPILGLEKLEEKISTLKTKQDKLLSHHHADGKILYEM